MVVAAVKDAIVTLLCLHDKLEEIIQSNETTLGKVASVFSKTWVLVHHLCRHFDVQRSPHEEMQLALGPPCVVSVRIEILINDVEQEVPLPPSSIAS